MNAKSRANYDYEADRQRHPGRTLEKSREYNRRHYANHRKQVTAHQREMYANDTTFREKKLARQHARYDENPEPVLERQRRAYDLNPVKKNEQSRRSYALHKETHRAAQARRRARTQRTFYEEVNHEAILARDGRWCHICQKPIEAHQKLVFDHVVPLARGGPHAEFNIKPAHFVCNARKGTKFMEELTVRDRRGPMH